MKQKAIEIVRQAKCLKKLSEMVQLTPVTLLRFAEGKRELKQEQLQAIVSEDRRQELLTGRKGRK